MEYALSLGTNIEDRLANLRAAKEHICDVVDSITAQSPVYETEPVDVADEYASLKFLNAVLIIESTQAPLDLASACHHIEDDMGRVRGNDRNTPRPIDIDVIYAGSRTINEQGLIVPHPRWSERRFVVKPLADVRPNLKLPGQSNTVADILTNLQDPSEVALFAAEW